jgi:hypothetical protein
LEDEKRDADGQKYIETGKILCGERTEYFAKEVCVFKISQQPKICGDAEQEHQFSFRAVFGGAHSLSEIKVPHCYKKHYQEIYSARFVVEIAGAGDEVNNSVTIVFSQFDVEIEKYEKKEEKEAAVENHRGLTVVKEQI